MDNCKHSFKVEGSSTFYCRKTLCRCCPEKEIADDACKNIAFVVGCNEDNKNGRK